MPEKHLTNHEKGLIEAYRVMGKSKVDISRLVAEINHAYLVTLEQCTWEKLVWKYIH